MKRKIWSTGLSKFPSLEDILWGGTFYSKKIMENKSLKYVSTGAVFLTGESGFTLLTGFVKI